MRVGIQQGRNRFAELVKIAEKGGVIIIMRHGKAVAELHPVHPNRRQQELGPEPFAFLFEDIGLKL